MDTLSPDSTLVQDDLSLQRVTLFGFSCSSWLTQHMLGLILEAEELLYVSSLRPLRSVMLFPGDFGSDSRYFWLPYLGWVECYWHLVGRIQRCCSTSYKAEDFPRQQRIIWSKMSIVLQWRNPALSNREWTFFSSIHKGRQSKSQLYIKRRLSFVSPLLHPSSHSISSLDHYLFIHSYSSLTLFS